MPISISFTPARLRRLLWWLIGLELMLAVAYLIIASTHATVSWGPIAPLLDLDEELSIPTWFSTVQIFTIALVLLLAAANNQRKHEVSSWLLAAGAVVFALLSVDEGAMVHERFTVVARRHELDWLLFGTGRGAWILPYLAAVIVAVVLLWRPLVRAARLHPAQALAAGGGAAMIGFGAAGFELVSYYTVPEMQGFWYRVEVAGEELLEMWGASLILWSALGLADRLSVPVESA